MKYCRNPACLAVNPQPKSNFQPKARYKDGLYSRCRICINTSARASRKKNPEASRRADKKYYEKNTHKQKDKGRFGRIRKKYFPHLMTKQAKQEWYRMFDEQGGKCAVFQCSEPLEVDHRHSDGKVRALLCNDCNTALARIKEDPDRAAALILYIKKHNT